MNDLYLPKELYPYGAILNAKNAFQQIAHITMEQTEEIWICHFMMCNNYPLDITMMEFENYIIDYINSEKIYANT